LKAGRHFLYYKIRRLSYFVITTERKLLVLTARLLTMNREFGNITSLAEYALVKSDCNSV
jgi:hypothetical protein